VPGSAPRKGAVSAPWTVNELRRQAAGGTDTFLSSAKDDSHDGNVDLAVTLASFYSFFGAGSKTAGMSHGQIYDTGAAQWAPDR